MSDVCGSAARRFLPFSRLSPVDTSRKLTSFAPDVLRQLLRLVREYPRESLLGAVREAGRYRL
jgi:hypothetical protein